MSGTLVLSVDRDDDYGSKGKVATPVFGFEDCAQAVIGLGCDDPEDSDINALLGAMKIYKQIIREGGTAHIALICGNKDVGYTSDAALGKELDAILEKCDPENIVLVSDGAEDEYIYPIIASKRPILSINRVLVKQAPNLENTFYKFMKMITEPEKRARFVAPAGVLVMALSLFFILPNLVIYLDSGSISSLAATASSLSIFIAGLVIAIYGYSYKINAWKEAVLNNLMNKASVLLCTFIGMVLFIIAAIQSYFEVSSMYALGRGSSILFFVESLLWPGIMVLLIYLSGVMIYDYQHGKIIKAENITFCALVVFLGIGITGGFDVIQAELTHRYDPALCILEMIVALLLIYLAHSLRKKNNPERKK